MRGRGEVVGATGVRGGRVVGATGVRGGEWLERRECEGGGGKSGRSDGSARGGEW